MHWHAEIKPKSYIHTMWTAHRRRSSFMNFVMFKVNDSGVFESEEIPEDKIEWFQARPEIFNMVVSGVVPDVDPDSYDPQEPSLEPLPSYPKPPKPRKRPVLKE